MFGDHEELSAKAKRIIESQAVAVPIKVLCEVVYVLAGVYKTNRAEISAGLIDFFENTASELPHHEAAVPFLSMSFKSLFMRLSVFLSSVCQSVYSFHALSCQLLIIVILYELVGVPVFRPISDTPSQFRHVGL
jgi:hypothetical protein